MARTSEVKRDARVGEAAAKRDATIKKCIADEALFAEQFKNKTEMAEAERNYVLKKASYDAEVNSSVSISQFVF